MKRPLQYGLLLAITVMAYGNSLFNSFTMDDELYIFRNPQVTHASLQNIFHANAASNVFRPLTFATLAANWAVSGEHAFGYHVVNLLLHGGATLLLLLLLRALLAEVQAGGTLAFVAALLFAVHPLHTEAVASIVGRSELLAAGFLFAGWLLHLQDRPVLGAICLMMALLSKESAIVFLPMVLIADHARNKWKPWPRYLAIAVVSGVFLAALWKLQGGHFGTASVAWLDNPLYRLPRVWRILNAVRIGWKYAGLLVYPAKLSCDYSYSAIALYGDLRHTLPALLATAGVFAAWGWAIWKRNIGIALAGTLYLVGFAVTSNVLTPTGTIMGERLAYLPSSGICLAAASCFARMERRHRTAATVLFAGALVMLTARTLVRNRDWKDNFALYQSAVATVPGSAKMHAYLGGEYLHRREFDAARHEFEIALGIYPDFPDTIESMALLESWSGNTQRATELMERALQLSDRSNINYDYMTVNLAAILMQTGRLSDALNVLDREIAEAPNYSRAWSNRAVIHLQRGETDLARSDAETALRLDSNSSQARGVLQKLQSQTFSPLTK